MQVIIKHIWGALALSVLTLWVGCTGHESDTQQPTAPEATEDVVAVAVPTTQHADDGLLIHSENCHEAILMDASDDICHAARSILAKNQNITYHYQRVGCKQDTCRQEIVCYSAVQYPKDSVLQQWMADVLANYYYDVTRQADIQVNGMKTEDNGDGEMVLKNTGCRPYQGILGDEGKSLFDYYQARVWVIGRDREEHGPVDRYGCTIYRCWQSSSLVSYFVGYSTDDPQLNTHYVCTFDRKTGHLLDLTDMVRADYMAELNELIAEAARTRHYRLLRSNNDELAIEAEGCDYASGIDIKSAAFTKDGLAISTGALAFDQWATATHILIIPYEKANELIEPRFRR